MDLTIYGYRAQSGKEGDSNWLAFSSHKVSFFKKKMDSEEVDRVWRWLNKIEELVEKIKEELELEAITDDEVTQSYDWEKEDLTPGKRKRNLAQTIGK